MRTPSHSASLKRVLAVCAAVGVCAVAAGCGSSSASSSSSGSVTLSAGSSSAGLAYAKAQVARYSKLVTSFSPPGPPLHGVQGKLTGKTVWYIPTFLQAPAFAADAADLAQALALVGAHVHICNADANPSAGSACIHEAVDAHAAAIVTDAIDDSFASSAYAAAFAAKIPVVATNNYPAFGGFPNSPLVTTVGLGVTQDARLAADWIIAKSGGKADVLYAADSSNGGVPSADATKQEFAKECPGCKLTIVSFSDNTVQNLATAVPAALTKDPNINYVYGGYDEPSGVFAQQGIKTLPGRHITYVTITGQPAGLQRIAAGDQTADPGEDPDMGMWNTADALFRILTHAPPIAVYTPALRIFTRSNVPSDTSSAAAYSSGAWYSNGGFKAMYRRLWGLQSNS